MRIILVRAGRNPVIRNIPHDLYVFQQIVGGHIEVVEPFPDDTAFICDESGRNKGLPVNRQISENVDICGDFFICGHDGEGLTDLPIEKVDKYLHMFSLPMLRKIDLHTPSREMHTP